MTNTTMPKAYNAAEVEEELYSWWEKQGFFQPEQQIELGLADPNAESFVISMPPPAAPKVFSFQATSDR